MSVPGRLAEALSKKFPQDLTDDLLLSYSKTVHKYQAGDYQGCLVSAGFFCEHALRALTFDMSGAVPSEIKNFKEAAKRLSTTTNMPEACRILIPNILYSSAYEMRSKRGAVHVKGVDPQKRDAVQAISAMSWALAEFLAQYGDISGYELDTLIDSILRRPTPFVEHIGGQRVVTQPMQAHVETLLIIDSHPEGVSRRELGRLVKRSPSAITHALTKLKTERFAHKNASDLWFITSSGVDFLESHIR